MRFLNPFSRAPKKSTARGGARRGPKKRGKTAARRGRTRISWLAIRRTAAATAVLAVVGGLGWLWQDGWFGRQVDALQSAALQGSADMGLRIEEVLVEGRNRTDGPVILQRLGLARGDAILGVDPLAAQQALETLPWVRQASVERQLPDTIYIRLQEREPLALWQEKGAIRVIDQHGEIVPDIEPRRFAHLPLVVGPDAARHAATLIAVVNSEPALKERVTAAVRVAGRRWNIEIEGRIDVRLPADDAAAAWAQLARIEQQQGLLSRDVIVIDLRLPDRLVVRTDREIEALASDNEGENT